MSKRKTKRKAEPINTDGLMPRQLRFVEFYLAGPTAFNATRSMIAAGYSPNGAGVEGHRLLRNPKIAAHVACRLADLQADTDEILTRLTDHARGSIEPMLDSDNRLSLEAARENKALHLIRKVKQKTTRRRLSSEGASAAHAAKGHEAEEESELAIELHDPQSALEKLARIRGMLTDMAMTVDLSQFTSAELLRIRDGENPLKVLLSRKSQPDKPDAPG